MEIIKNNIKKDFKIEGILKKDQGLVMLNKYYLEIDKTEVKRVYKIFNPSNKYKIMGIIGILALGVYLFVGMGVAIKDHKDYLKKIN